MIGHYLKSLKSIILSLLVLIILSSCQPGCVEPWEFDSKSLFLSAYPKDDVSGDYANGQVALPYSTGLRTNGQEVIIKISGAWSSWEELNNYKDINVVKTADVCFKKENVDNCICKVGEYPQKRTYALNAKRNLDYVGNCENAADQENPNLCTCTQQHGLATDKDNYVITTNHQGVDEIVLRPDDQRLTKFTGGMGAYVGLYGRDGITMPKRLYHMYPGEEVCDIGKTAGKCVDEFGNDASAYIYRSPNKKIFVKDDKAGNNGSDINEGDDEYHNPGEILKLTMYDQYYADNYGGYNITLMGGVMKDGGKCIDGIVECIVGVVEDALLGKVIPDPNNDDKLIREGGILQTMYNLIVQDRTFITIIQMSLILYVTFFGMTILMGGVEISPKEISTRIMKVALVLFFTSSTSWYWYNEIIVGFFKYGLDSVIGLFSGIVEANLSPTSLIMIAQSDRLVDAAQTGSQASRFAYADIMILDFLSKSVHQRIWGLLFGVFPPMSLLYILCIYILIGFLIYTILTAAIIYITALIRLVLVLALGPLFILASLFSKTDSMFKGWLAFIAARALEMLVLFLILYIFLVLIDTKMKDLLYFKTCLTSVNIGFTNIDIQSIQYVDGVRSHIDWILKILTIGGLIFLLNMIIDKIPLLIQDLVVINGKGTNPVNASGFANGLMKSFAGSAIAGVRNASARAYRAGGDAVSSSSTLTRARLAIGRAMPIRGSAAKEIDKAIEEARVSGEAQGKSGKSLDQHIRSATMKKMSDAYIKKGDSINTPLIGDRLNKKLVEKPLRDFINKRSEELKSKDFYGKDLENQLRKDAHIWAKNNLNAGDANIDVALNSLKSSKAYIPSVLQSKGSALKDAADLSGKDAVRKLSGDFDAQKAYADKLQGKELSKFTNNLGNEERKRMEDYLASANSHSPLKSLEMINEANQSYLNDLVRYGYRPDAHGNIAPFQAGAPSQMALKDILNQELERARLQSQRDEELRNAALQIRLEAHNRSKILAEGKARDAENLASRLRQMDGDIARYQRDARANPGMRAFSNSAIDAMNQEMEGYRKQYGLPAGSTPEQIAQHMDAIQLAELKKAMELEATAENSILAEAQLQQEILDNMDKIKADVAVYGQMSDQASNGLNDFLGNNKGLDIITPPSPDPQENGNGSGLSNDQRDKLASANDKISLGNMKKAIAQANLMKLQLAKFRGEPVSDSDLQACEGDKAAAQREIDAGENEKARIPLA